MKRALLLLASALAIAIATPARADEPGITLLGAQASLAGGARFATPNGPVDAELAKAGWRALPAATPDAQIRFGVTVYDFSVDMHFAGIDGGFAGPPGSTARGAYYRGAIGVDFGTRFRLGHGFALAPLVGIGTVSTTLCFSAPPSGSSSPTSSAFAQVARNPGQGACPEAMSPVLDLGLSAPWTLWSRRLGPPGDLTGVEALTLGPKLGYSVRLSGGRTWSSVPDADYPVALPKFTGPVAPIGGAYAGLELQYRFGLARPTR